jgi:L-serine dehydratase
MRGPSSSHTAASFYIGVIARALLGEAPASAAFTFDPGGSYGQVYAQQGSDRAFAAGLMDWSITDDRFYQALDLASSRGLTLKFKVEPLAEADHPNTVDIRLTSRSGRALHAVAKSTGGGAVIFSRLDGWPVHLAGDAHEVLVAMDVRMESPVRSLLTHDGGHLAPPATQVRDGNLLMHVRRAMPLDAGARHELKRLPGIRQVWTAPPVFFAQRGEPLLSSAAEMVALGDAEGHSLGEIALAYEATLLGLGRKEVLAEMARRFEVMRTAVERFGRGPATYAVAPADRPPDLSS